MADTVYREAGVFPKDEIDPDGKLTEAQETRLTKLWQNFEDYEAVYMLACYARAYSKAHPKLATKMAVKKAYEGAAKERQKHVDAYHNAAIYYLKAVIEASPQVAAQKAGAKLMQAKEKKRAFEEDESKGEDESSEEDESDEEDESSEEDGSDEEDESGEEDASGEESEGTEEGQG